MRKGSSVAAIVAVAITMACSAGLVAALVWRGGAGRASAAARRRPPAVRAVSSQLFPVRLRSRRARRVPAAAGAGRRTRGGGVKGASAVVVISSSSSGMRVPRSFLGISTEYWALPLFERHSALLERVLSLVSVPGDGPLVLRVGGDSADSTFWDPSARRLPRWAFGLTRAWLAHTASLLRQTGARLILDLNLITNTPSSAAGVAAAARRALPRGSMLAFEIGNEPDLYSPAYWQETIARGGSRRLALPREISPDSYVQDYGAYARVLARVAPSTELAGPVTAYPGLDLAWISRLVAGPDPRLGFVSAHLYPYSACAARGSRDYPTIARLLSEDATAGLANLIGPAVGVAQRARRPLRLTELNSVTCGGVRGVSNSFATALWAPDALFELLDARVSGVNVHVRENAINGAFAFRNRSVVARPLLYGLIMFARTLGPRAQVVNAQVSAARSLHLKVWAVRTAGGQLHVLLIDKGEHSANVRLELPAGGTATVQRLLAPSVGSTSGVTLNGQCLDQSGRYWLSVAGSSAALMTVRLTRLDRSVSRSQAGLQQRRGSSTWRRA